MILCTIWVGHGAPNLYKENIQSFLTASSLQDNQLFVFTDDRLFSSEEQKKEVLEIRKSLQENNKNLIFLDISEIIDVIDNPYYKWVIENTYPIAFDAVSDCLRFLVLDCLLSCHNADVLFFEADIELLDANQLNNFLKNKECQSKISILGESKEIYDVIYVPNKSEFKENIKQICHLYTDICQQFLDKAVPIPNRFDGWRDVIKESEKIESIDKDEDTSFGKSEIEDQNLNKRTLDDTITTKNSYNSTTPLQEKHIATYLHDVSKATIDNSIDYLIIHSTDEDLKNEKEIIEDDFEEVGDCRVNLLKNLFGVELPDQCEKFIGEVEYPLLTNASEESSFIFEHHSEDKNYQPNNRNTWVNFKDKYLVNFSKKYTINKVIAKENILSSLSVANKENLDELKNIFAENLYALSDNNTVKEIFNTVLNLDNKDVVVNAILPMLIAGILTFDRDLLKYFDQIKALCKYLDDKYLEKEIMDLVNNQYEPIRENIYKNENVVHASELVSSLSINYSNLYQEFPENNEIEEEAVPAQSQVTAEDLLGIERIRDYLERLENPEESLESQTNMEQQLPSLTNAQQLPIHTFFNVKRKQENTEEGEQRKKIRSNSNY